MISLRVLIAEDEPLTAQRLRGQLEALGHRIVGVAYEGRSAVAQAESLAPDLVFLDIKMPGLDGLQVTQAIMARRPAPIILVTAHTEPALIEEATTAGVMGYLVKPVDARNLGPAIGMARARFAELLGLRREVSSITQALRMQRQMVRAKGILRQRLGLSESEAHARIVRLAQNQRCTLLEAADHVIEADKFFAALAK